MRFPLEYTADFVVINTFKKYKIIVIEVLMIQEVILSKIP